MSQLFLLSVAGGLLSASVRSRGTAVLPLLAQLTSRSLSSSSTSSAASPPKSKVYTRTGDKGSSSLYNGERRSKASNVFHALGETDELNACIGIAREHCELANVSELIEILVDIQSRLFDVGAAIATPMNDKSSTTKLAYTAFDARHTSQLEKHIDILDAQLPPLSNFVIPSGGLCSTHLNLARAVCRRAERATVSLILDSNDDQRQQVDGEVGRYLNRLSDFLFVASRFAAQAEKRQEIIWKKSTLPPTSPPSSS